MGLVPIEQLKVGDLVLSRSAATGEQAYKRVLQTFRTEDQEIRTVNFEGFLNGKESEYLYEFVFATKEHPFYVEPLMDKSIAPGWQVVEQMWRGNDIWGHFARANGDLACMGIPDEILGFPVVQIFDTRNHGFVFFDANNEEQNGFSMWFDGKKQTCGYPPALSDPVEKLHGFRTVFHGATFSGSGDGQLLDNVVADPACWTRFRATVFNIEVEGFHTYFVGELGVWAHNASSD